MSSLKPNWPSLSAEPRRGLPKASPSTRAKAHVVSGETDVDSGRITVDGIDIRDVNMASLRCQIGLVAQHTLLLNGSIADNIAYGSAMASPEQIQQAAAAAHAHEFIRQLPQA